MNILLVDAPDSFTGGLIAHLVHLGHEVRLARSVEECKAKLQTGWANAVVIEPIIPTRSGGDQYILDEQGRIAGLELLQEMTANDFGSGLVIILQTAWSPFGEEWLRYLEGRIHAIFNKPYEQDELVECIQAFSAPTQK